MPSPSKAFTLEQTLEHIEQLEQAHPDQPVCYLSVPEGKVAYRDWGDGIPIVMLHGFMATHAHWWYLVEQLADHYRCLAPDLLGFGRSSQPNIPYSIAVQVEFIRHFVEGLGLSSFYLLGHSFGGWVAAAYALRFPQDLAGLILLAPAGIRDDSFAGRYRYLQPLLWSSPWVDRSLSALQPLATLLGKGADWQQIRWLRRSLLAQPVARQFLSSRRRPQDAVDTVEADIHTLRLPTLVIAAAQDETIPLWHCQTYAQRIPQARLVILPEADHRLPLHYAEEVAEWVDLFLT
ncbi:MAG: alpha/beta hydrolase [Cyanobacteriota bacterium]|nr:alpha/beta hydrolase [Cyanobacteriota bacterium]